MAQLQATGLTRALTCRSIPPLALSRSAERGSRPPLLIIWSRGAAVGDLVSLGPRVVRRMTPPGSDD